MWLRLDGLECDLHTPATEKKDQTLVNFRELLNVLCAGSIQNT